MAKATNLKAALERAARALKAAVGMPGYEFDRAECQEAALALEAELDTLDPCLLKAEPGEPLFILRAQDETAPTTVKLWALRVQGKHEDAERVDVTIPPGNRPRRPWQDKLDEARKLAAAMEEWQNAHRGRVKLPD